MKRFALLLLLLLLSLAVWPAGALDTKSKPAKSYSRLLARPSSANLAKVAPVILQEFKWNPENIWVFFRGETPKSHDLLALTANHLLARISGAGVPVHVGKCPDAERYYNLQTRIFLVDSIKSFGALVEHRLIKAIRSDNVRYLVLLDGHVKVLETRIMSGIFRIMFEMFMLNVDIVCGSCNNTDLKVYTFYPYTAGDCQSFTPILIHTLRPGECPPTLTALYPPKMHNMNGCPLTVMLGNRPPFIKLLPGEQRFEGVSGTDGEMLRQFSLAMNFTVDVVPMNRFVPNRVFPNGTMSGVYKSLANQEINLTLGDFSHSPDRLKYFTLSQTYYQSNMRVLIESSGSYSPLEVLFYPYKTDAWCFFISVYCARWLLLKFFGRQLNRQLPQTFRRFLLAMWLVSLFEVRTAYEGTYFKFMHKRPLKPPPTTFQELRKRNYVVFCGYTGTNFEHALQSQSMRYEISENDSIAQQFNNLRGNYGILLKEELYATYMESHPEQRVGFHFLQEPLVMDFHCIYFPLFSHLIERFDELIILYRDAGLIKKLVSDFVQAPRSQPQLSRVIDVGQMLMLSHLWGIFQLLIALWLLALLIFAAEQLSLRYSWLRLLLARLE